MPKLSVNVSHALGQEEATRRLKERFAFAKRQFGDQASDVEEEWDGHAAQFAFKTLGVSIRGTVTSADSDVEVVAVLPIAAMLFKGTIEKRIREELTKTLTC